MLLHPELEFHNVAELSTAGPGPGLRLQRLPESLRPALNPVARDTALNPTHVELRYVSAAPEVRLTLHSEIHHEYIRVFQGDFFREEICLEPGQTRTLIFTRNPRLLAQAPSLRPDPRRGFSPEVIRVRLSGTGRVRFVGLETSGDTARPPTSAEKPALALLAYGSSITQGFSSSRLGLPWLTHAADLLGTDCFNLGSGGSCHCEPELAEHLAARTDWHAALLELGVNMLNGANPFTDDAFARRAERVIAAFSARPERAVFVITAFTGAHDQPDAPRPMEPWRDILRDIVTRLARPNVHLIEGRECLSWSGLTSDLIHPADSGHAQIGAHLAARIAPFLTTL